MKQTTIIILLLYVIIFTIRRDEPPIVEIESTLNWGLIILIICIFVIIGLVATYFIKMDDIEVAESEREFKKKSDLLHRKKIEGTEIYQDKHGQKWVKKAGIFKKL